MARIIVEELPIESLRTTDFKIRETMDARKEFNTLLKAIDAHGIIHPLHVRKEQDEKGQTIYTINDGQQRFACAQKLGFKTVPCRISEGLTDDECKIQQLILNKARVPQTKTQERDHILHFMSDHEELTRSEVAELFGLDPAELSSILALQRLIPEVEPLVNDGTIKGVKAVQIARLDEEDQRKILEEQSYVKDTQTFINYCAELKKARKTGKKPKEYGFKPRAGTVLSDIVDELQNAVDNLDPKDEEYPFMSGRLFQAKWVGQIDDESLAERKAKDHKKKTEMSIETLEKRKAEMESKIAEYEARIKKNADTLQEIEGV